MSAEDTFSSAKLPCNRPPGATSGCLDPLPASTSGDLFDQLQDKSRFRSETYSLLIASAQHREAYEDRVIAPKAKLLQISSHVGFGFLYAAAVLYLCILLKNTYLTLRPFLVIPTALKKRRRAASWKLNRAEREFATLKTLYENGLITEQAFLKRKQDLMQRLGNLE
ncbi:MAG: hypothetical protein AB7I35_18790 [Ramlibacter sp.]